MQFLKNSLSSILALNLMMIPCSYAQDSFDVDQFLRKVDLTKLIDKPRVLNLIAQFSDPNASTHNINDFDSFIALGSADSTGDTVMTEFDRNGQTLKKVTYGSPWVGVQEYEQSEIPAVTLQNGLGLVKTCMARKRKKLPEDISHVIIYHALTATSLMVYDYVFKDPNLPVGACQEVLYLPATNGCQMGMVVNCHIDINDPLKRQSKSSG